MTDIMSEFEEDAKDYTQLPSNTELSNVRKLAQKAAELFRIIKTKKSELEDIENKYNEITQKDLPNQMADVGLSEIKLEDGTKLVVQDIVTARLPKDEENRHKAVNWLEVSGYGSIVNHTITCAFQKQDSEKVSMLRKLLEESGYSYADQQEVHWKTLESLIKSLIKEGAEIPRDLFSVYEGRVVKIK